MGRVIVIEFVTLDGYVTDPDGSGGTPGGGWAFRHGPEAVAGDKFRLGPVLDTGVKLLGRTTWELFAGIWPHRTDPFSATLNRMAKRVVTSTRTDVSAWPNSSVTTADLETEVKQLTAERDVVVAGSIGVVHALAAADLVDSYRLLVFPTVLGGGRRLFAADQPVDLVSTSVEQCGAAALLQYDVTHRAATSHTPGRV